MNKINVNLKVPEELLKIIDEKVIETGKHRKHGRAFDRSEYICYALSEYLKLPAFTRRFIAGTHSDFKRL